MGFYRRKDKAITTVATAKAVVKSGRRETPIRSCRPGRVCGRNEEFYFRVVCAWLFLRRADVRPGQRARLYRRREMRCIAPDPRV